MPKPAEVGEGCAEEGRAQGGRSFCRGSGSASGTCAEGSASDGKVSFKGRQMPAESVIDLKVAASLIAAPQLFRLNGSVEESTV